MTNLLSRVQQARSFAAVAREDGVSREIVRQRFWKELEPGVLERWQELTGLEGNPPLVWVLRELEKP